MLSFALLVAIASVSSAFILPATNPRTSLNDLSLLINGADCTFYPALNTLLQCGPRSHLMQYSHKYCQRLLAIRDTFENTQYQDTTRECLQKKLFAQVQKLGQAALTCDGMKKLDLDSHGSCLAVSFKQLSASDVEQFLGFFEDTTVNYAQLCKLANSFAGHYSQPVRGDLMVFMKKQLKEIFPEGDTSSCTIKEKDIVEEVIEEAKEILDQVKDIKDDIKLIIEKVEAIRDDYQSIKETIAGMKDGSISELDGTKAILEKSESIANNTNVIIATIEKIFKAKPSPATQGIFGDIDRVLNDLISIVDQIQGLKNEVLGVMDNVYEITDLVNRIKEKKIDVFDGLEAIVNQAEKGYENIHSILDNITSIEQSAVDIFDTIFKGLGGSVDEIIGGVTGGLGGLTGGLGGFGK